MVPDCPLPLEKRIGGVAKCVYYLEVTEAPGHRRRRDHTFNIGSSWCKRENVLSGTGKVATMLPPGVVFGWVDREGAAAASDVAAEAAPADSMAVDAAESTVRVGRATLSRTPHLP